jgi:hypothetical protein
MKDSKKTKHGLEDEPLGNEDQKAEDGPKSFEDKRPADLEIPKGIIQIQIPAVTLPTGKKSWANNK